MKKQHFSLDDTLLSFRDSSGVTKLSTAQLMTNVLITGNTGSGKTSSSGATIAMNGLKMGYGFLVFCVKETEAQRFVQYAKNAGREKDIVHVRPGSKHYFDFLRYESQPRYNGKSITSNIVACLKAVLSADMESKGRTNEEYWSNALDELLTNTVDLCLLAFNSVTVDLLYEIVTCAPKSNSAPLDAEFDRMFMEIMEKAKVNVDTEVFQYIDSLPNTKKELLKSPINFEREVKSRFASVRTLHQIDKFFFHSYRSLSSKTRSIVESSFSGMLFRLLQEPLYSLFCKETNFQPEDVYDGKIIILDIPVLTYQKAGLDCQRLFKFIAQTAFKRRPAESERPVIIWCDEAHILLMEEDTSFLSICREKRVANVMITQNISNFYYGLGSDRSDHKVKSLLSLLSIKIFHCNDHMETNEWASRLIGEAFTEDYSYSDNLSEKFSSSRTQSFKKERMVAPEAFLHLKTGGSTNQGYAEAYVILQGSPFHDGLHHRKVAFKQHFLKN